MDGILFHVSSKLLILLLSISYFTQEISCLYEDQAGKVDWKISFIGKVKYADFGNNKLLVATEENVIAALNTKTGDLLWRQVMENEAEQQIQFFNVNKDVTTVSGDQTVVSYWSINNKELIHVIPIEGSHIEITSFYLETGEIKGIPKKINTPWLKDAFKCASSKQYFACVQKNGEIEQIRYINLIAENSEVLSKPIEFSETGEAEILSFEHEIPSVLLVKNNVAKIVHFKNDVEILAKTFLPNVVNVKNDVGNQLYQLEINVNNPEKLLKVKGQDKDGNNQVSVDVEYPKGLGAPYILAGQCRTNNCDLLLSSIDHALLFVRIPEGKILWTREEALSDIVAVEFFELPVSELDASIENEFKTSSQDILSMFINRILTQSKQLTKVFIGSQLMMNSMLVRDDFGLHKIIVVVTRIGKIFAIDTLSGQTVWSYRLPHVVPFDNRNGGDVMLFVQRTARYSPFPAQCTLLAKDDTTGNTVMFQFDPITGLSSRGVVKLDRKVKQAMLLPYEDKNHLKPFITIYEDHSVKVHPEESTVIVKKHVSSIYLYMVDEDAINGYSLQLIDDRLQTFRHWNFLFRGSKLAGISTRPSGERVHSQGRVLPDRSVYYKYVNPNMIAVATISEDPVNKQVLSIYLIDGITGMVIYALAHKRARGPVNLVHSENWLVYTFFNERYRRRELAALELYEGHVQSNSTFFSSYAMSQLPQVQAQSYILPAVPLKVTVTLTERGITNKCLLVALNTGAVVEIPWALIQPRFADIPCGPEESCYPYMPEIPLHPEATINYNQTLSKVKGISVAPARLESTSHILVHGLDMFYTRVAPSKTFDVLKEDFDYKLIILVLIGLIAASYVSKTLASRKAIKQAWK
ncbi:hypothetical protein HHI36_019269 [Cryptolaemus montrouzieri]|uniref:ER membrane protein complex subunit 1 n=1 Tax=Cryptolaemus montrouzieri TaxID=559131 RepID=A0ABD2P2E5_9CUCU